jgi:hypothetical protein
MLRRWATGSAMAARASSPTSFAQRLTFSVALSLVFALVFLAVAAGVVSTPARAGSQPDAQDLAARAIHRLDLQTELPREEDQQAPYRLKLPPETVWIAVAIGVVILLYAFRDLIPVLRAGRGSSWTEDAAAGLTAGSRPPEIVLEAADDLAAQGRFVEAMHVLLLQALNDIRRRLDEEFADSMTSREILRSRKLSDTLRRPLREVINRVEWTYFGGHPADRDDYLACRASFSALAQALPRSIAA